MGPRMRQDDDELEKSTYEGLGQRRNIEPAF